MTDLVTIRKGVTFAANAAASFRRAEKARGRRISTTFTYRSPELQQQMLNEWNAWLAGRGPKPNFYRPIAPKYSWHCKGTAFDSFEADNDPGFVAFMEEYGWLRVVADERWHYQYYPAKDKHRNEPAGGDEKPFPTPPEEDEMKPKMIHYKPPTGLIRRAVYVPGTRYWARWDSDDATFANKLGKQLDTGDSLEVTAEEFTVLERAAQNA